MKPTAILFFILIFSFAKAQNIIVKDAETKLPISSVTIFNDDKSKSAISNTLGNINLDEFSQDEILIVKHISYKEELIYKFQITDNTIFLNSVLQDLDEIVLSASKFTESKTDVAKSISTISAKSIGFSNPQTSADALQQTGKVYIQKSQLGGGSPIIRGFSANRLLINVDGVRMNNAIFRSGNLQNVISIDPFTIQNTEVILGPGTTIYGSDAIGGVMSFNTLAPKPSYKDSTTLKSSSTLRYATANEEQTVHSNLNIGLKKWAFLSSFTFSSFDDLRMGSNGPKDYLRPEFVVRSRNQDYIVQNKDSKVQKYTGYEQLNFMQKVLFEPNKNLQLNLGLFYTQTSDVPRYDRLLRYENETLKSAEWFYGPQKWFMAHASINHVDTKSNFYDNAKLNVAFQKFNESRNDRDYQAILRNTREEQVNAYSFNLDLQKQVLPKLNLFYGLEYVYNTVSSSAFQKNLETLQNSPIVTRYPDGSTWQSAAAYMNLKYKLSEMFTLQSGVRYNNIISKAGFSDNNEFLNLPFSESENNNDALTGSFGFTWLPMEFLQWRFNASSAFRAPNIDDIGKVFDSEPGSVVIPNNDLKPEYAYGLEFGLSIKAEKAAILDFSTYYTFLEDALVRRNAQLNGQSQINYDGQLSQVQSIQNASKSRIYGFEVGAQFNFSEAFFSKTQFNIIGGKEIIDAVESPVRHVVPNFGNSHLVWQNNRFKIDGFINFSSELSNNQIAITEQEKEFIYALDENANPYSPSWYTLNLSSQYKVNSNTTITASLENITDQRYRPYSSGISAPGRNLIIALKYTL